MWNFLKISLLVGLLFGFSYSYFAQAEVKPADTDAVDGQVMLGIEEVMKVVGKVNMRQMDASSKRTFDEFFNKRNQMNDSVQLLENSAAAKQHPTTSGPKAPPKRSIKAF